MWIKASAKVPAVAEQASVEQARKVREEWEYIQPTGVARLAPCSVFPNCVSTVSRNWLHAIAPIPYEGPLAAAKANLLEAIYAIPRATLVKEEALYLHVEYWSKLFEFVDDVEVIFDEQARQIHFRAAARLGKWDFGINRRRMEKIRRGFRARAAAR